MHQFMDFWKTHGQTIEIVLSVLFIIAVIFLFVLAFRIEGKGASNTEKIKKMTAISVLSAISVLLYYFLKFPLGVILPFIPGFLDIHFSAVPIYIGGYLFGPITGSIIAIIRMLVKLPATTTFGVGEVADLFIGISTVLVSSLIYHKNKTKKTALISNALIVATWTFFAIFTNWLFVMPFYVELAGKEAVIGMLSVIPKVTKENYMLYYILIAVIPFNLILSSLVSFVTFITYKRLSRIYQSI